VDEVLPMEVMNSKKHLNVMDQVIAINVEEETTPPFDSQQEIGARYYMVIQRKPIKNWMDYEK
jgi:hypothetical protein